MYWLCRYFTVGSWYGESQSQFWPYRINLPVRLKAGYDPAMTILVPALAIAFAALCVWLGVRIVNRRERWAKCTVAAVVVLALVVYPLSIGPMVWLFQHGWIPGWVVDQVLWIYAPLGYLAHLGDSGKGWI